MATTVYNQPAEEFGIAGDFPAPFGRAKSLAWSIETHVLSWSNVSWEVDVKSMFSSIKTPKMIVNGVSGKVTSGQVVTEIRNIFMITILSSHDFSLTANSNI